jgi:prepilin-type N-terminal cleavage/methylation domain-containing protein
MKKDGFTLIELLAVISLLGILATLAVTSAINVSIHLKEDMFCEKIAFIETAAKQYGSGIYEPGMDVELTVAELVKLGALKKDQDVSGSYVLDPRDNSSMDAIKVKIYAKNKRAYAHVEVDQSMCES